MELLVPHRAASSQELTVLKVPDLQHCPPRWVRHKETPVLG